MGLFTWLGLRRRNKWEALTLLDNILLSPLTLFISIFYHVVLFLRGQAFHPSRSKPAVRVVCISDTHDQIVGPLPDGDILIHAGDLTNAGTAADIQKQIDWLKSLPHAVKVVIAGNHDSYLDRRSRGEEDIRTGATINTDGILYLEGQFSVQDIRGRKISIFGAPDIPACGPKNFAWVPTLPL